MTQTVAEAIERVREVERACEEATVMFQAADAKAREAHAAMEESRVRFRRLITGESETHGDLFRALVELAALGSITQEQQTAALTLLSLTRAANDDLEVAAGLNNALMEVYADRRAATQALLNAATQALFNAAKEAE